MRLDSVQRWGAALLLITAACGSDESEPEKGGADSGESEPAAESAPKQYGEESSKPASSEWHLPALADGYQRYEAEAVEVAAGSSDDWAQWVGGPLEQDYDVVDLLGYQSRTGHHALLYATTEANPPGFTRLWRGEDQFTTRMMGGVGGEGGANANLPDGVVFRVKAGSYLMLQTHFLNPNTEAVLGHSAVDLKLMPVDPNNRVASIMATTTLNFQLPPHASTTVDVDCKVQHDLEFLQLANHMHDYGRSVTTEYVDPEGERHALKIDETWTGEWALNANFDHFPPEAPRVVPAGSTIHTRCTWENTADSPLKFPTEMCVFFGFVLNNSDITCTDNHWIEATP